MLTVIRVRRMSLGITQRKYAEVLRMRPEWLNRIEQRKVVPSQRDRERLCEALGCAEDDLFDDTGLARLWGSAQ